MRIKSLQVKEAFGIKKTDVDFDEKDDIVCVVDEFEGDECPFDDPHPFMSVMNALFLSTFYEADYLRGNGEIQCFCERFEQSFLISLKGKREQAALTYQGKKMTGERKGVEETCFCGEEVGGKMKWIIGADHREILYPSDMRDYCKFEKNSFLGLQDVIETIDLECSAFGWLTEEEWEILKRKMREYLAEFDGIPFIEGQPIAINRQGELTFQGRDFILDCDKYFSEDEVSRIQFLYWLATLNMIKRLCEDIGRDGDLPVFVEDFFEGLEQGKDHSFLFDEMRKTGRQIFIFLNKRNMEIEKNCDKILVKGANGEYNIFTNDGEG